MSKLVTIKIGSGNSDFGYPVTLQIDREHPASERRVLLDRLAERNGKLPPAPNLLQSYRDWQQSYRALDLNFHLGAPSGQTTNISISNLISNCQRDASRLLDAFNTWLKAESFRDVWDNLKEVSLQDEVRFVLQIEDPALQRLPWQVAEIFATYGSMEIVFSSPQFERIEQSFSVNSQVKILSILGNNQGIDISQDRESLKKLSNAKVCFLDEPNRQQINNELWQKKWDILSFSGHSYSADDNKSGRIIINQNDSLSIEELRYGLKQAILNGLKIAIFNSCDGLGLAASLSDLQIPLVIVMREPVPNRVAQTFLAKFLELYSQGRSFDRAVREAREQLQGLEDKFPCATWLPTVYQQKTYQPPTWVELYGGSKTDRHHLKQSLLVGCATTIAITATRLVGILQPLELPAFDLTMRSRPAELKDEKILVIEVTSKDTQKQRKNTSNSGSSLADEDLNRLLTRLKPLEPRIIGIDNYLSHQIDPKYSEIHNSLKTGDLVAVCKTEGASKNPDNRESEPEKSPPKDASKFGFGDTLEDIDKNMRRHLIWMNVRQINPTSNCKSNFSLSWILAYNYLYLEPEAIQVSMLSKENFDNNKYLDEIRKVRPLLKEYQVLNKLSLFDPSSYLTANTGGYQGFDFDNAGYQILLNYRAFNNSARLAIPSLSLHEALELPVERLKAVVRDRLILIGTTDPNYGDIVSTPYGQIPGVFHQAQMTSQLLNTALNNRPLFWAAPWWIDITIVLCLSTAGALLARRINRWQIFVLVGSGAIAILFISSICLLSGFGWWFPLIPSLLGLAIAGSCVKIYPQRSTKLPVINSKSIVLTAGKNRI